MYVKNRAKLQVFCIFMCFGSFVLEASCSPVLSNEIPDIKNNEILNEEDELQICGEVPANTAGTEQDADDRALLETQSKLMRSYMNLTVNPCEDFYEFACGNFPNIHEIPEHRSTFQTFSIPREKVNFLIRDLIESVNDTSSGVDDEDEADVNAIIKMKRLYDSCMDLELIEKRGIEPMLEVFKMLGGWPVIEPEWNEENFDLLPILANLSLMKSDQIFSFDVITDLRDPENYILAVGQASASSLYKSDFSDGDNSTRVKGYKNYMVNMMKLFGVDEELAVETSEKMFDLEQKLTELELEGAEAKNFEAHYKKYTFADLKQKIPNFDWDSFLYKVMDIELNETTEIVLYTMEYVEKAFEVVASTEPRTLQNWLLWKFVESNAIHLDSRFDAEEQTILQTLTGVLKRSPRWERCVRLASGRFNYGLGSLYIQKYFDPESKRDIMVLTEELRSVFREILAEKEWLVPATKELALEKLDAMSLYLGYDDVLVDEKKVNKKHEKHRVYRDKFFENIISTRKVKAKEGRDKYGTKVDRAEWEMQPYSVNAGYSMGRNRVYFPAAILQPPFYHKKFPRALNFGGIGTFIGHEMTHGFDESGRKFDKDGALRDWWDEESKAAYAEKARCFETQYNSYTLHGHKIDGNLTLGENISDMGGLRQNFYAYKKWLKANKGTRLVEFERLPGIDLTSTQLFFLSFSQMWCASTRPASMIAAIKSDVHAPAQVRVKGTLANFADFAKEFNCEVGSPMNPESRCELW